MELLVGEDEAYGLVPLTRNKAVLDLFVAHVNGMSSPTYNAWRVLWVNGVGIPTQKIVDADVLATIADDGNTSGTQYTRVAVPAANADFISSGVRAGDVVRAIYASNGFGDETYQAYIVDAVLSEDELRLVSGPAAAVSTASRIEVWRTLTATGESAAIALAGGSYGSNRVRFVWPDKIKSGGTEMDGYFLCAALAGYRSAIQPHQPMTRAELSGFDNVDRTVKKFNRDQLDAMALAGVWIVTQNTKTGKIYTRHAVTTGEYSDVAQREESITSNVDDLSFSLFDVLDPYIGRSNVTPTLLSIISHVANTWLGNKIGNVVSQSIGSQLLVESNVVEVRQHAILKDHVYVGIKAVVPSPANNIEAHLGVVVGTDQTAVAV